MERPVKNTLASLGGAFILITLVNILSKGLGFFREVLFANYFGISIEFDVYLVGAVIPVTLNTIILFIGQNYFIPAYNKNKIHKQFSDTTFTFHHIVISFAAGLVISIGLFFFSEQIVKLFINPEDADIFETAVNVLKIFLLSIPINSVISILIAREQAELKFRHPALSRLILNLTLIPILIFFTDNFGIFTIPLGFVAGTFLQLGYLFYKSTKLIGVKENLFVRKGKWRELIDSSIIGVLLIEAISQLYLLVDRYFFESVSDGGISALNYATNLNLLPVSIFAVALATVVFPKLSETISGNKLQEFSQILNDSFSAILFLFVPVTIIYLFYGDILIKVIFERGEFNTIGTSMTYSALKFYVISLVFYSAYSILNKTFYAAGFVRYLLLITIVGIILKIILNAVLVGPLDYNGLALATTISYLFFFLSSLLVITRKFNTYKPVNFLKELIVLSLISYFSYIVSRLLVSSIQISSNVSSFAGIVVFIILTGITIYFLKFPLPEVIEDFSESVIKKLKTERT